MRHRILFYTHDSFGLGHFRRSLTIASFLARHIDNLAILMLTSIESPAAFEVPRGVDFVRLPAVWKAGADQYRSRHLRVSFNRVKRIREHLVKTVTQAFDPAMVVVDNVPRGLEGELLPTLRFLRKRHPQTRIILTLRDVLDAPDRIVPQWRKLGIYKVLRCFYDEIWVAGCRSVFDPTTLYEFPKAVAEKVKFCGYIVRSTPPTALRDLQRELRQPLDRPVVVSCGGGGDGFPLLNTYIDAADPLAREGLQSVIFLGPDMPPAERRRLKERLLPRSDRFLTFDFRPDLTSFLALASASISMGGYNTTSEVVALRKLALLVPRVEPRVEQLLRAEALAARGLLRVLHPDHLNAESLRGALCELLEYGNGSSPKLPAEVDFAGLSRIARRVRRHLAVREGR